MKPNPYARSRGRRLNATLNVVPYIDVMLVLLVIFMITAPILTTGVDIDLPKAKTQSLTQNTQLPVIVSMDAKGELFLSYQDPQQHNQAQTDVPMSRSELISTLQRLNQDPAQQVAGGGLSVLVNADKNNPYARVMQLMASLQQAGIEKVGLMTAPPSPQLASAKKSHHDPS